MHHRFSSQVGLVPSATGRLLIPHARAGALTQVTIFLSQRGRSRHLGNFVSKPNGSMVTMARVSQQSRTPAGVLSFDRKASLASCTKGQCTAHRTYHNHEGFAVAHIILSITIIDHIQPWEHANLPNVQHEAARSPGLRNRHQHRAAKASAAAEQCCAGAFSWHWLL